MNERCDVKVTDNKKSVMLGILGGLGPMASAYFYEMITEHTYAESDRDHIDIVISSRASTPDRTAFILGRSKDDPLAFMIEDVNRLAAFGADIIAVPCNTAHYFFDKLNESTELPIINIIDETCSHMLKNGKKKVGILATDGTIMTNTYQRRLTSLGLDFAVPNEKDQAALMDIIYKTIKQGKDVDLNAFTAIADSLKKEGCDSVILGCTELSLIKKLYDIGDYYTDSLEVLAHRSIIACGRMPIGFGKEFDV